jgi:hypothetical protein
VQSVSSSHGPSAALAFSRSTIFAPSGLAARQGLAGPAGFAALLQVCVLVCDSVLLVVAVARGRQCGRRDAVGQFHQSPAGTDHPHLVAGSDLQLQHGKRYFAYRQQSSIVDRFDVAPYPEGQAGRHIYSSSHTFAIPATVSDRPAAIKLLRFLTSRESQAYEARLGTLPARNDSLQDARSEADPLAGRRWALLERAQGAALVPPKHANYPAVEDAIWEGVREALLGNKSVEKALKDTEAAARRAAEGA